MALAALSLVLPRVTMVVLGTGTPPRGDDITRLRGALNRSNGEYRSLIVTWWATAAVSVSLNALLHLSASLLTSRATASAAALDPFRIATIIPMVLGPLWVISALAEYGSALIAGLSRTEHAQPPG